MKHSDANVYPLLEDLISIGLDGLQPVEPNLMDLADVKERYGGRLFFSGGMLTALMFFRTGRGR